MKIHIWIKKEELFNGKITEYHRHDQQGEEYINISLTADEFFKLEDDLDLDDVMTDLEERIYKESQSLTGGEFSNWYNGLTEKEIKTYKKIYDH